MMKFFHLQSLNSHKYLFKIIIIRRLHANSSKICEKITKNNPYPLQFYHHFYYLYIINHLNLFNFMFLYIFVIFNLLFIKKIGSVYLILYIEKSI